MGAFLTNRSAMQLRRVLVDDRTGKGNRPEFYRRGIIRKVQQRAGLAQPFPAILRTFTPIPGKLNRFYYTFEEAQWNSTNLQFETLAGGRTGTAVNTIENGNDGDGVGNGVESGGVNTLGPDFPPGFTTVPIRGATTPSWTADVGPCVIMHAFNDDAGETVYAFTAMNAVDGTCQT